MAIPLRCNMTYMRRDSLGVKAKMVHCTKIHNQGSRLRELVFARC